MSSSTDWYAALLDRVAAEERRKAEAMSEGWRRSSFCNGAATCVEVRTLPDGGVEVRDGKNPDGPVLRYTREEWAAFVAGVHAGEFDLPGAGDGPDGSGPSEPQKPPVADSGPSPVSV